MKRISSKITYNIIAITVALAISHSIVTAQAHVVPLGFDIVGTWDLQVAFVDCTTGAPLFPPGRSLVTYAHGGTYIEESAGTAPSRRYPGLGVWRHVRARTYALAFKAFNFNADGTPAGKLIVTAETEHNQDDTLTSKASARFFNAAGDLTATRCVDVIGTRFTGEQ